MYTKQQASELKREFWASFGLYMAPVLSADGDKVSWINYKTGQKGIFFKMEAGNGSASIAIELSHTDMEIQQFYFEQFIKLKTLFHEELGEEWSWIFATPDEFGKPVSK